MEPCLICGEEYDPVSDPNHEDDCEDKFAESVKVKVKTNPDLRAVLERLLNEKE